MKSSVEAQKNSIQIAMASLLSENQPPPILKLTTHCCDEIFEYLSMKDLHSIGHTCKALQKVAGEYFQQYYSTIENTIVEDSDEYAKDCFQYDHSSDEETDSDYSIYTIYDKKFEQKNRTNSHLDREYIETRGFNRFIKSIICNWKFAHIHLNADKLVALNQITMNDFNFTGNPNESLRNRLNQIEMLHLQFSKTFGDFCDILELCGNLKRLHIQEKRLTNTGTVLFRNLGYVDDDDDDDDEYGLGEAGWLLQKYPNLQHFELSLINSYKLPELNKFFELNPNLKHFSTTPNCISANQYQLRHSIAKLDILELKIFKSKLNFKIGDGSEESNLRFFDQLYERNFYKRLFLYVQKVNESSCDFISSVKGLEKLCVREYSDIRILRSLIDLKELAILDGAKSKDMDILAKSLVNLQRLYVNNANINDIMPFICQSTKLNKVKVIPKDETNFNGGILPLEKLNREREKLVDAHKVIIYVPDNIFLKTKWTTRNGDIDLKFIEMKRAYSYEWNHHYP